MEDLTQVYLEIYKGKHGQSDAEYQAGRSDAGKRISGDEKTGPRHYTLGRARGAAVDPPTAPGAKPVNTPKLSSSEKEYHQYNKSGAKSRAQYNKVGGPKGLPEEKRPYPQEKVDRKRESVNQQELDALKKDDWHGADKQYRRNVALVSKKKMNEEEYDGLDEKYLGRYQTHAGHWKDRDEDESIDDRVNDMLNKQRQQRMATAGKERLKAKGKVPTKNGKPVFEAVVEYLYVEGYADTIEAAELMAENIGDLWADSILEAVDWDKSDIGITGQPIPKKNLSAKNRYEFEKKRRENLKKQPGTPGDSPMVQALRQKAKDTGNYAN